MDKIKIEIIGEPFKIPASYTEKDYTNQTLAMTRKMDFSGVKEYQKESPIYTYTAIARCNGAELEFDYSQGCGCSRDIEDVKKSMRESLFVDARTIVDFPDINTMEDYKFFADSYGYNCQSIEPYRVWKECKKHYDFLIKAGYTDEEIIAIDSEL